MKRDNLEFSGHFGDVTFPVKINHYWEDSYHLTVNHFHKGMITKREGHWIGYFNNVDYTAADVMILADLIEANFNQDTAR